MIQKSSSVLELEHEQLKKKYDELEKKYVTEKKTQAMHAAMEGINYNSRKDSVVLSWDDLEYNPATDELTASGYKSPNDYFLDHAKKYPYEVVSGYLSQPAMSRSTMTLEQRAKYIEKHGPEGYLSLPL
jgi:hypothetical protein